MKLSKKATTQQFTSATDTSIKIRCASKEEAQRIDNELRANVPGVKELQSPSIEEVSASLGSAFFKTAIIALAAGMLGITIYLAIRFECHHHPCGSTRYGTEHHPHRRFPHSYRLLH